jgi:ribokinase
MGLDMLKQKFSSFEDCIHLRIKNGKQGYNIAFEFFDEVSKVNLNDIKDNNKFGPETFSSKDDVRALQDAAAVAVVDWSSNSLGTELAEYVFAKSARALHFIDPGDMQERKKDIPSLLKVIRDAKAVLSVNENEYDSILATMDGKSNSNSFSKIKDNEKKIQENLKKFAKQTGININLHDKKYTVWSDGNDAAFCPTKRDQIRNLNGAGDSWDAANTMETYLLMHMPFLYKDLLLSQSLR